MVGIQHTPAQDHMEPQSQWVALDPSAAPIQPLTVPSWWPPQSLPRPQAAPFRPLGASLLEGLAVAGDRLLALDRTWGYIFELNPDQGVVQLINPGFAHALRDTYALAISSDPLHLDVSPTLAPDPPQPQTVDHLWVARDEQIFQIPLDPIERFQTLEAHHRSTLPDPIEGLAITADRIYATCYRREKILVLDRNTGTLIQEWSAPGVGREQIHVRGDVLWISDRVEETLYVLDRHTGDELARILTPFPGPTGLAFWRDQLWIAYTSDEAYIHDSPNDPEPLSVGLRNKTLIAPLHLRSPQLLPWIDPQPAIDREDPLETPACPIHYQPQILIRPDRLERVGYTLSNGYRVELSYLEELDQEDPQPIENLVWKIALPCRSLRQQVQSITPISHPFEIDQSFGQQLAVFQLGSLQPWESRLFGWKAILDLYNIKYSIQPEDVEDTEIPPDLAARYLLDDDDLAMDTPIVQAAAAEAIGTETNILRKMQRIREFVYDRLSYRVTPRIEPPDIVLRQREGSCGEYVGVLLALARLNGIACRTVGRYKCPPHPDLKRVPLFPEYNHVWIEFYLPGWGWVPMESNPDDLGDRPYPQRYFMGLPWTHAEIAKGIPFETCNATHATIGQLAVNHVQFRILEEL